MFNHLFILLITIAACKAPPKDIPQAKEDGSPILPEQTEFIGEDVSFLQKLSKDELMKVAMKEPFNMKETNPKPLTREDLKTYSRGAQQAVGVLVNRGLLEWKADGLYDSTGLAASRGMVDDFWARLKIFLAQQKIQSQEKAHGLGLASADEDSGGLDAYFTAENAGITLAIIGGLGTLMWGYREYKLHEEAISKIKTDTTDVAEQNKRIGSILDFNSPRNGKFVYTPFLFATALGTLGMAGYQIHNKFKEEEKKP
jgi:hypothetical protein